MQRLFPLNFCTGIAWLKPEADITENRNLKILNFLLCNVTVKLCVHVHYKLLFLHVIIYGRLWPPYNLIFCQSVHRILRVCYSYYSSYYYSYYYSYCYSYYSSYYYSYYYSYYVTFLPHPSYVTFMWHCEIWICSLF